MNLFKPNKRGNVMVLASVAIAAVVVVVVLMVGQLLNNKISGSIDRGAYSAADNATFDNIQGNVRSGFDLTSVGIIVGVAAGLIAIVIGLFR